MEQKLIKRFNVVTLTLTKECNGVCDYCLFIPTRNKERHKIYPKHCVASLAKIINSFELPESPYLINVQIVGGEPLIYAQELMEIMSYLTTTCPKVQFRFNLYTNGILLKSELLLELNKYPITITVSLDDLQIANTHRLYCGRPMGPETVKNLIEANRLYPNIIRTNTVISEANLEELIPLYQFHLNNNIKRWGWGFLRTAIPEESQWTDENFARLTEILSYIAADAKDKPIQLYNILEYRGVSERNFTSENIPLYLNLDETISTLAGNKAFRVDIADFNWNQYFAALSQEKTLYFLDGTSDLNKTECIHCHYRDRHLAGQLKIFPLTQCLYSTLLRNLYNKYFKELKE